MSIERTTAERCYTVTRFVASIIATELNGAWIESVQQKARHTNSGKPGTERMDGGDFEHQVAGVLIYSTMFPGQSIQADTYGPKGHEQEENSHTKQFMPWGARHKTGFELRTNRRAPFS